LRRDAMFVAREPSPVRSTCPYCGVGCGILAMADGTIIGDPQHPANAGRLCSKGSALAETLGETTRLLHPMWRGRRISWEEALDRIATTFAETVARHGPDFERESYVLSFFPEKSLLISSTERVDPTHSADEADIAFDSDDRDILLSHVLFHFDLDRPFPFVLRVPKPLMEFGIVPAGVFNGP